MVDGFRICTANSNLLCRMSLQLQIDQIMATIHTDNKNKRCQSFTNHMKLSAKGTHND